VGPRPQCKFTISLMSPISGVWLLPAGHTVHATCRKPTCGAAVAHLRALPGASQRLRLFEADLLLPGSFDEAVAGCDAVLHTASPYTLQVSSTPCWQAQSIVELLGWVEF
jgi:nucleoside-diphosphate-sugar epimerase